MKTLVYCTTFSPNRETWALRHLWWLRSIKASELNYSQILMVDDGSPFLPEWAELAIVQESAAPTPLALQSDAPLLLYHFEENLGRLDLLNFPGWYRSFAFGALYAQAHGFDKVIHLESDAHLVSPRLQRHFNRIRDGWTALWCEKYDMPELSIQVAAGLGVEALADFARRPYSDLVGKVHEYEPAYHSIQKNFIGDRYGEHLSYVPGGIDYVSQVHQDRERAYYWWIGDQQAPKIESVGQDSIGAPADATVFTLDMEGDWFGRGWSQAEAAFRWSVDFDSILNLPALARQAHVLKFSASPCGILSHVQQKLLILFNDRLVWEADIRSPITVICEIPEEAINSGSGNVVRLVHPDASAPSSIVESDDDRKLAFWISDFTLSLAGATV